LDSLEKTTLYDFHTKYYPKVALKRFNITAYVDENGEEISVNEKAELMSLKLVNMIYERRVDQATRFRTCKLKVINSPLPIMAPKTNKHFTDSSMSNNIPNSVSNSQSNVDNTHSKKSLQRNLENVTDIILLHKDTQKKKESKRTF